MSGKKEDVSTIVRQIARDRRGKPLRSLEERVRMLWELYDGATDWLSQSVIRGKAGGTGAALYVMERVRLEIIELQRASTIQRDESTGISIGFELPGLDTISQNESKSTIKA